VRQLRGGEPGGRLVLSPLPGAGSQGAGEAEEAVTFAELARELYGERGRELVIAAAIVCWGEALRRRVSSTHGNEARQVAPDGLGRRAQPRDQG